MTMEKGLLYNFTGNGKGKTSAALGVVLRALGRSWKVAVLQFMKGERETGERLFFQKYFPEIFFEGCGLGRTCRAGDHAAYAREGWKTAADLLKNFDGELLVLDELNVALSHGYLDLPEVIAALQARREGLNVIVTGRNSPPELREISDLVSDIAAEKHPYQQGVPARKGLDY